MAQVSGIDHWVIRIEDLEKSKRFYDNILGFMGFELEWEFDLIVGWNNGKTTWTGEADEEGKKHPPRWAKAGRNVFPGKEQESRQEKVGGYPAGCLPKNRRCYFDVMPIQKSWSFLTNSSKGM